MMNAMVFGGVFDRHPTLTLVFAELGIHWFAGAVQHMEARGPAIPESGIYMGRYPYELTPAEFTRRNIRVTPLPRAHQSPVRLLEEYPECVVFSSDYAHHESNAEPTAHYADLLTGVPARSGSRSSAETWPSATPGWVARSRSPRKPRCDVERNMRRPGGPGHRGQPGGDRNGDRDRASPPRGPRWRSPPAPWKAWSRLGSASRGSVARASSFQPTSSDPTGARTELVGRTEAELGPIDILVNNAASTATTLSTKSPPKRSSAASK